MINRALKLLRQYHNLKQNELAKKLGISPSHLSEIEKGDKPVSFKLLEKYSEVLNVPISTITMFSELTESSIPQEFPEKVVEKALRFLEWNEEVTKVTV